MPESRKERNPSNVTVEGGSLTVDPYDTGTQQTDFQDLTSGTHNIAAGKYRVRIHNTGLQDITVNSDTVQPGDRWEASAYNNPNTQKIDLTPAIEIIIPAGGTANYMWDAPSV